MASYNKVILLGNLTRDPQLSYLPSQTPVVEFGIATNRRFRRQDGTQSEEVCFTDCQMFGKRAEVINKYLKKGDPIFVEGRLKFDSWTSQDGAKRSKLRVFVENFEFVGSGSSGGQGGSGGGRGGAGSGSPQDGGWEAPGSSETDFPSPQDDDIPF